MVLIDADTSNCHMNDLKKSLFLENKQKTTIFMLKIGKSCSSMCNVKVNIHWWKYEKGANKIKFMQRTLEPGKEGSRGFL